MFFKAILMGDLFGNVLRVHQTYYQNGSTSFSTILFCLLSTIYFNLITAKLKIIQMMKHQHFSIQMSESELENTI